MLRGDPFSSVVMTVSRSSGMFKCQKVAYLYGKRDLFTWQKRPFYMAKDAFLHGKRDLLHGKRDLFTWQKRPIYMAKETYLHGKRGPFT